MSPDHARVLADVTDILHTILDDYELDEIEIGMDTTFHFDLELESIELVRLAGHLEQRYGDAVNFAQFIAGLTLDEIIELRVGRLVDHVVASLHTAGAAQ